MVLLAFMSPDEMSALGAEIKQMSEEERAHCAEVHTYPVSIWRNGWIVGHFFWLKTHQKVIRFLLQPKKKG